MKLADLSSQFKLLGHG